MTVKDDLELVAFDAPRNQEKKALLLTALAGLGAVREDPDWITVGRGKATRSPFSWPRTTSRPGGQGRSSRSSSTSTGRSTGTRRRREGR